MSDNYVLRSFLDAPKTAIGGIVLFFSAALVGELLAYSSIELFNHGSWDIWDSFDSSSIFALLFLTVGSVITGTFAGFGIILCGVVGCYAFWWLQDEVDSLPFFFVIAANQVGFVLSASIIPGEFLTTLPGCILALAFLLGFYWFIKGIKIFILRYATRET